MVKQEEINNYWEKEVCDTRFSKTSNQYKRYEELKKARYSSEPYILEFAFDEKYSYISGKKILEIGVGSGLDLIEFLKKDAFCSGIDATTASIEESKRNINVALNNNQLNNLQYLLKCDAEKLPFNNNEFDILYSHGVLHHAKNTNKCIAEAIRVLKPGGVFKIMVYSDFSATGSILWLLYGLARLRPFSSQKDIISKYLESPGTKSYSYENIRKILEENGLKNIILKKHTSASDLMLMPPSQKYTKNIFLKLLFLTVQKVYPRYFIKRFQNIFGLALTVTANK